MELVFHWFWVVKLAITGSFLFATYKAIKCKGKSKAWNIVTFVMALFMIYAPVKLDTGVTVQQHRSNEHVKRIHKELPPKVSDNSFEEAKSKDLGIKKEDLTSEEITNPKSDEESGN